MIATIPPRRELKYIVDVDDAARFRDRLASFMHLDAASSGSPRHRYGLTSLYLDSPQRVLAQQTVAGSHDRYKLRLRAYDNHVVLAELKHRQGDIIRKRRVPLPVDPDALRGDVNVFDLPGQGPAWHDFLARCGRVAAEPAALVRYHREAWEADVEHYVRVTFDQQLLGAPAPAPDAPLFGDTHTAWTPLDDEDRFDVVGAMVLVEVKLETQVPRLLREALQTLGWQRRGFSKYLSALQATGAGSISPRRRRPVG